MQPMAPPSTLYSREEFNLFHNIDRTLYIILVMQLHRDPLESMQVIALCIWLERIGFTNLVKKVLPLPYPLINEIAEEALICLHVINNTTSTLLPSEANSNDIPLIHSLLEKEISLPFFYKHRVLAKQGVSKVLNEVCARALSDITENMRRNLFPSASSSSSSSLQRDLLVPQEDRTMFLTFSKGYPVYECEVMEFFTSHYGDCIESVQMQEVEAHEQSLFATIVFRSASTIEVVLKGKEKAKFGISGKHVWARKFVPKKPKPSSPHPPLLFVGSLGLNM